MSAQTLLNRSYSVLFLLVILLCGGLGYVLKKDNFLAIPPQTDQSKTCDAAFSDNTDVFDVYVTEHHVATEALKKLCNNPIVQRQFGNVRVTLGHNEFDTFRQINHGISDLALAKSNVVEAFGANQIYSYDVIGSYPNYNAYFIALKEKPRMTKEYLFGKRIGMLDYPSSRSGHIVPKKKLKELGLTNENIRVVYYNSHQEMRRALIRGEVDIISSYWSKADEDILSRNYIAPLGEGVTGMRWYLKMQTENTDLRCTLMNIIEELSVEHPKPYYKTVILSGGCNE